MQNLRLTSEKNPTAQTYITVMTNLVKQRHVKAATKAHEQPNDLLTLGKLNP
jgi:hypothetical protein